MNQNKSILVTGGAGYIGSHTIAELIQEGYDVVSIDNFYNSSNKVFDQLEKLTGKKIHNISLDLCDYEKIIIELGNKHFDAIIHFAAYKAVGDSVKNPLKYYKNNIGALLGILEIAQKFKIPSFVFSSSCAVYNPNELPPYTEKNKVTPTSPYGMTKLLCEEIIQDYVSYMPAFHAVSLRYFNPAGAHFSNLIGEDPKEKAINLVPAIIRAVRTSDPLSIFGDNYDTPDGTCIRDYIHVVDLARAHISALKHLKSHSDALYEVFNLGTGKGVSVLEMIKSFEEVNDLKVPVVTMERRQGDMPEVYADTTKAEKYLKWKAKYSLKDIMKSAWQWEEKNNISKK